MVVQSPHAQRFDLAVESLLGVLEDTLPLCAVLFDSLGRVHWLSVAAAERFGMRRIRSGPNLMVSGDLENLEALRRAALEVAASRDANEDAITSALSGILRSDERLVIRGWGTTERLAELFLVAITTEPHQRLMTEEQLQSEGLSPREAEVALLVGQGHTVSSAAGVLGIKLSTASTYLKRVYKKLRVSNKAELACLLLKLQPIDPSHRVEIRRRPCTTLRTSGRT